MNIVLLQGYNNYFNRQVKIEDSLSDYTQDRESVTLQNINFNPNDSITTTQIINWDKDWNPDYALILDENNNLVSRWFVMEAIRTRGNQYQIQLKRDSIADYKPQIIESPVYIEKATLNSSDPLIYNSEGMQFNQIKKDEILLKDETQIPWLVGYTVQDNTRYPTTGTWDGFSKIDTLVTKNDIPTIIKNNFNTNLKFANDIDSNASLKLKMQGRTSWNFLGINYYSLIKFNDIYNSNEYIVDSVGSNNIDNYLSSVIMNSSYNAATIIFTEGWGAELKRTIAKVYNSILLAFRTISSSNKSTIYSNLRNRLGIQSYTNYQTVKAYDGVIYKDGDHFYKIHIDSVNQGEDSYTYQWNDYNTHTEERLLLNALQSRSSEDPIEGTYTYQGNTSSTSNVFELYCPYNTIYIWKEEVYNSYDIALQAANVIKTYIPSGRNHLNSQPYDMFCIPFGDFQCNNWKTVKDVGLLAARTIAKAGIGQSGSVVYDVQILPYCPLRDILLSQGSGRPAYINESLLVEDIDFTYVKDQNNVKKTIIFWCNKTNFTFNINKNINIPRNVNNTFAEDIKIANECDMYKLCSPNYNGEFEFNLARNDTYVDYFNVDCSYKPFNPYIHVVPNFHGLYGQDFDDARGLICGGDFSISIVTDAWEQYQLQNKNYQEIFNTKITSLDATKTLAQTRLNVNTLNDVFNNNAVSAYKGAMSGGVAGGIIAGVQATVNSGVNYGLNSYTINESNRIAKKYVTDNFNYQLGNIQALPYSLSKCDTLTYNNKYFPFIEYYTCTDQEKEVFKLKMKYNGMTVMRIGKISDYLKPDRSYIKGQLIRLENIAEDNHLINDIFEELDKGVYI